MKGTLTKVPLPFSAKSTARSQRGRPTGHNSSTPPRLPAHRLHRVGDSASRAFLTAHRKRPRCCRVIVASLYACSTIFSISSIPMALLCDSHSGRVRATGTPREAFSACAFASSAFIPWTGHKYLSSCRRTSHSQGQSHPDSVLYVHIDDSFRGMGNDHALFFSANESGRSQY